MSRDHSNRHPLASGFAQIVIPRPEVSEVGQRVVGALAVGSRPVAVPAEVPLTPVAVVQAQEGSASQNTAANRLPIVVA